MPQYKVDILSFNGDWMASEEIDASAEGEAKFHVQNVVRRLYERPDSFVQLDGDELSYTIGAGFWSRRGYFSISLIET